MFAGRNYWENPLTICVDWCINEYVIEEQVKTILVKERYTWKGTS